MLFFPRWDYLIHYRNNNHNKAETAVIMVVDIYGLFTIKMIEIGLVRESNPTEGRADTCPVVSVWLVGWLVG